MFDAIVLGVGGVGSAALLHLARRGVRVLGIDRFAPGHAEGSSHGESRVIRKAYFEHEDYVPILLRAYELWRELESDSGADLYNEVGLVECGLPGGVVMDGLWRAAAKHGLPLERLGREDFGRRFPFALPDDLEAVYESEAGVLRVEECVRAHARLAVFAAGLSGHGFKFASVLGEILADLVVDGRTQLPIDFLRCVRPELRAAAAP